MGSLFDLAAELSQYEDARDPLAIESSIVRVSGSRKPHHDRTGSVPSTDNQDVDSSVLSLLDETLLTIYAARQPPPFQQPTALVSNSRCTPPLIHSKSTSVISTAQESSIPRRPRSPAVPATPLQNVFTQRVTFRSDAAHTERTRVIPPPPTTPAFVVSPVQHAHVEDPDVTARRTLSELQDELEQLPADPSTSPRKLQRLQRSLSDKYLHDRLNKLPSTPFVQLARRKTQQKIEELLTTKRAVASTTTPLAPVTPATLPPTIFPRDQHEMLTKLAQIPTSHIAKLSATQQQMVQFAKRYDKILRLSSDELRLLPVSQVQLLQQLQQQLQAARNRK